MLNYMPRVSLCAFTHVLYVFTCLTCVISLLALAPLLLTCLSFLRALRAFIFTWLTSLHFYVLQMPSFFYVPGMASFSMYFNLFTCLHFICVLSLFKNAFIFFTCLQFLSAFHSFILVVFIFHVLSLFYVPTFCWRAFAVLICFHIFYVSLFLLSTFMFFSYLTCLHFFICVTVHHFFPLNSQIKKGRGSLIDFLFFPTFTGIIISFHFFTSLYFC